tara:strand:- start:2912 stop:3499 length:588 start_codon:yes stop_codon:yes gene_type:complete
MSSGYLKVILGSMFSGKTTELIKEYNRYTSCGFKCCFINHRLDDRYGSGCTTTKTHSQITIQNSASCHKLQELFKCSNPFDNIFNYDVYLINEGQFFEDLYYYVDLLINNKNKKVYVCGLNGDFERKKFGSILDIIPLCDDVVILKAICKNCKKKDGIFTNRLSNETEQTLIGTDNYTSLCRICYNNNLIKKKDL